LLAFLLDFDVFDCWRQVKNWVEISFFEGWIIIDRKRRIQLTTWLVFHFFSSWDIGEDEDALSIKRKEIFKTIFKR